ncbi:MAG: pilus assembly protein CpaF [Candidatus Aldehydirespiratoraceae bacterium]|jgi:pilus assembly protein CpaF
MIDEQLVARVHRRVVNEDRVDEVAAVVALESPLLSSTDRDRAVQEVEARLHGLGPLELLMADPTVTEIMANGPGVVWVERAGAVEPTDTTLDARELMAVIERALSGVGRRIDPLRPWVDARLPDGSRVNVVAGPIAVDGPYLTIRRFGLVNPELSDFASTADERALRSFVERGDAVLISGGTGAGKTTLLNALAGCLAPELRVVTVEDAAELAIPLPHVVRMEGRPPGIEGDGEVSTRDLVRTALRMRPDRLIVGEVRGPEAYDLLQAMHTGHRGGMSTIHANSPQDALDRLSTLVLSAGMGLDPGAVDRQIRRAIDWVVQVERQASGRRRVVSMLAVEAM